jgi:NADPH2 dehydrogenase
VRYPSPGRDRSVEAFRDHWREVAPDLDCDPELEGAAGPLGQPIEVAGKRLTNRFCIHPMEGWDGERDGTPSALTHARWRNFGRSGAKLIWGGEAFAVRADGRANPRQLFLNSEVDVVGALATLRESLRDGHREIEADPDELLVGLQLTHSGRYARPEGPAAPRTAVSSPVLDTRVGAAEDALLSDAELEAIGERYVEAARMAQAAGFEFVDIKCCHGYLMHELLGARTRPGPYGGDLEGRTRLFREIVAGIRAACPGLVIAARVSMGDVYPHAKGEDGVGEPAGWKAHVPWTDGFGVDAADPRQMALDEPLRFLELLQELGITLVNVSLGTPYTSPHLQRPAAYPPSDGYQPPRDPLAEVAQHVRAVRAAKRAHPGLVVVGSGYSYLQEWLPHVAQHEVRGGHVDLVGLGRMVLSYPELPRDVLAGRTMDRKRICRTFSDCTTGPRKGLVSGCYPLDPGYRNSPDGERLRAIKAAVREGEA